ncbi:MAG: hypothetical protein GTO45_24975 [Candidatus Aminicenantes bacterium]|nr:hypothetical protein [Candidatus Aminicenantes bacterium]NIM81997.1 hypothetical protein [Candidatus Aminicenantes bacterium]NIN21385.1 hypothetical protein [Candidatus Aminicenantes bacterium]NIN45206.1 hypothetical protein [Candidatus Aminicenantes bacterium]NIN88023.1 hypothetical protein [Candidatus Aminicenantes bacterium]
MLPELLELGKKFIIETYRLFIEISPYLILGFLFAGLLHTLLGEKYIKKHFAKSGLWSTMKAAIFGIPLPVCSCAVIPLAESLRKDGASKSATMAFLVSTPSSGVDSILATYALMGPVYAIFRPIASFFSGILVGIITHIKGGEKKAGPAVQDVTNNNNAKKSLKEIFVYGFKVIPAEISKWLVIGVVIGGAISALVPADFGAKYLLGSSLLNYVVILLISIPLYVCATGSIPIAAALITKGVLPGAALALLIAGPATNSVTISFVYKRMGKRVAFFYVISIIVVSVVSGLIFDVIWRNIGGQVDLVAAGGAHLPHSVKLLCAIVMVFIFINTKYDIGGLFKRFRKGEIMKEENIHTIKVPDMTCQHCKMTITNALKEIPEIQSVSINLNTREVSVEAALDRQVIVDRIKEKGYKPE